LFYLLEKLKIWLYYIVNITQLEQTGTKKYLPPRHKGFFLLFVLSVLVPGGDKKKVLPQNAHKLLLRN